MRSAPRFLFATMTRRFSNWFLIPSRQRATGSSLSRAAGWRLLHWWFRYKRRSQLRSTKCWRITMRRMCLRCGRRMGARLPSKKTMRYMFLAAEESQSSGSIVNRLGPPRRRGQARIPRSHLTGAIGAFRVRRCNGFQIARTRWFRRRIVCLSCMQTVSRIRFPYLFALKIHVWPPTAS